ncbi:MAG: DUF4838 domain-containing protein [Cytophagales bacterium]|nr:DUF4838 domain-containing protein [Cytophagales bacterium]
MEKLNKILFVLSTFCLLFTGCDEGEITLTKNGKTNSRIVIPVNPTNVEKHAAEVLKDYIQKMSGAELKIVSDDQRVKRNDINIGKVNRPEISEIDFPKLEKDGYVIQTKSGRLTIAGGSEKGTLYGVYGFLEELGCRKYSSKVTKIPGTATISVENLDIESVPVFKFRDIYYRDAYVPAYMEWHGLDEHGEFVPIGTSDWGMWCHTTERLVPPKEYCGSNSEYFSMIEGERLCSADKHNLSDICFSNDEVFEIAAKNLKKAMDKRPEATYWSVSQMDNARYCRCPECEAQYERSGGPMGSILPFVNRMAKKFPDKTISTLSYWYSTRPPKNIKPEENVNILLCNIGSPRHIPIEEGDSAFCADLEGWGAIHDNILLWDYVIQFSHLIAPFPNLRTLQPNLQYLNKNGVVAMFEQANREIGGEFCELKAYLMAKLLWDPFQDIDPIIDDFVNGYYGAAGKYVRKYIDLMHDTMEQTGAKLSIFGRPWDNRNTFLTEEMIDEYYAVLDNAAEVVKDDPELLFRVKTVRMQIDYAVLDIAKKEVTGQRGALEKKGEKITPKPEIEKLLYEVTRICNLNGVTRVHEWNTTPNEYASEYHKFLLEQAKL